MAQTATRKGASGGSTKAKSAQKKRAPAKSKTKSNGKPNAKANGSGSKKTAAKSVKGAAGGAAAKSALTTRPGGNVRMKMAGAAIKAAAKKAGEKAKQTLPVLADGSRGVLDKVRDAGWDRMAEKVRTLPVQRSLDVGVPIEAAWDEWMRFDWLPDGAHRVEDIERDGDSLFGRLAGPRVSRDWEAEITDERVDQSFAWQTVEGSDTSGLVTFHRLSDRLTRLELQLDVVPEGMGEALSLVLRRADRCAENVLRGFKAQVEALDPDEYPDVAETAEDEEAEDEEAEDEEAEDDEAEDDEDTEAVEEPDEA